MKFIRNSQLRIFVVALVSLLNLPVSGQVKGIQIKVGSKALNEVLISLRDEYDIRFSFDHSLLSSYRITADTSFSNPGEALKFLIKGYPLDFKKSFGTYIIYPVKPTVPQRTYLLSGRISDANTGETLPYSHIRSGSQVLVSDQQGNFSLQPTSDGPVSVTISYLGYYVLDTILSPAEGHMIELRPALIGIRDVLIKNDSVRIAAAVTSHPGEVRLNPRISTFLPGNGDHSLFNLLRLQPGILAAGEQSNDLIIWGCYEGQSQVLFDGFTLYGLKNFNDQISAVNPLMIKDIRILKGGFEPRYGNRVGGIVDITGYDGNPEKLQGEFIINNMTVNGMLSVPVTKRSTLLMAFRNTYYNLYDNTSLDFPAKTRVLKENPVDFIVQPDYSFRDFNLKYSGTNKRGDQFGINFLYGSDTFSYHMDIPLEKYLLRDTLQEKNRQLGTSGNYKFRWKSGQTTTLTASYSASQTDISNRLDIQRSFIRMTRLNDFTGNQVQDLSFRIDNRVTPAKSHTLEYGAGLNYFMVDLLEDSSGIRVTDKNSIGWLAHGYIQDRVSLSNHVILQYGARLDLPSAAPGLYLQPRISLEWEASRVFRLKTSLGKYNQFIVKSTQEDDAGNYQYFWALADNQDIPVVSSGHFSIGGYLDWETFQIHVEAFLKSYQGITRFKPGNILGQPEILHGEGRGAGLDFYIQKQIGRHSGWIAYTLSRTDEHFPNNPTGKYLRAPQDQTHELKIATLLNFHPVYFSACYVYGSGFPNRTQALTDPILVNYPYNRLDLSLTYRLKIKKSNLEAGLSVLNLLNTQNIKVSNFVKFPLSSTYAFNIQAEAIPFTPTLFLKISF